MYQVFQTHLGTQEIEGTEESKTFQTEFSDMSDEKLCLKWSDYQENVNSTFGSLRDDKEFSDMTLACELVM